MAGGIIIRAKAAIDAALVDLNTKDKAALVRQLAHDYTAIAHNVVVRKWIELKALFGFHG